MSAYELLFGKYEEQGWSNTVMLSLCMEYIDNQQNDDAFDDFLAEIVAEDKESAEAHFFDPAHTGQEVDLEASEEDG